MSIAPLLVAALLYRSYNFMHIAAAVATLHFGAVMPIAATNALRVIILEAICRKFIRAYFNRYLPRTDASVTLIKLPSTVFLK